ncbi:MAG TPA: cupin domain-containing protein [Kofleriaceae bacterium]|jgi:anti-sigma factor ChrR (cupin superfamily)|nr:cupin domain-containing protein [Kofleriaceae bacterium]
MMSDVRELLPLYALGVLEPDEAAIVERALATDPALAAELAELQAAGDVLVSPVEPPPEIHARLLASVGGGRFEKLSARMASLFDVTVDRARELLGLIERTASWEVPMPGLGLVHFEGGPAYAAADCGFVKLTPGTAFPHHAHLGEEVSLVLAGTLQDHTGRTYGPGDEVVSAEGSEHDVKCVGEEDCIYAARAMNGISIAGAPARPPSKS